MLTRCCLGRRSRPQATSPASQEHHPGRRHRWVQGCRMLQGADSGERLARTLNWMETAFHNRARRRAGTTQRVDRSCGSKAGKFGRGIGHGPNIGRHAWQGRASRQAGQASKQDVGRAKPLAYLQPQLQAFACVWGGATISAPAGSWGAHRGLRALPQARRDAHSYR